MSDPAQDLGALLLAVGRLEGAAAGSTALSFLFGSAPSGWDVRSGGSGSGSGSNIEVWKDSGTQGLVIENRSGGAITLDVTLNP